MASTIWINTKDQMETLEHTYSESINRLSPNNDRHIIAKGNKISGIKAKY